MAKTIDQMAESYRTYAYDDAEAKHPDAAVKPYDKGYTDAAALYAEMGFKAGAHKMLYLIERAYVSEKDVVATLNKIHKKINELKGL